MANPLYPLVSVWSIGSTQRTAWRRAVHQGDTTVTSGLEDIADSAPASGLTHVATDGSVRMVDVGSKETSEREAVASAVIHCMPATIDSVREQRVKKGDVLAVARVAGIMAAKQTSSLIPLCHPIALTSVEVGIELGADSVDITATARTRDRTGVEMEALTAAAVAALTIYDMCKAIDRSMTVSDLRLERKSGGRSGEWTRE